MYFFEKVESVHEKKSNFPKMSRIFLHFTIAYSKIVTKNFHQLRRQLKEQSDYKEL